MAQVRRNLVKGLRPNWCPLPDSNRHSTNFKFAASTDWAKGAGSGL